MKYFLLFAFSISAAIADAQIDPLYAQYLSNALVINPAYTGLNNSFNASVGYRRQWAGYEGSPTTMNACVQSSVRENRMGLGFLAIQDAIGNSKNTSVNATYAYKIHVENYTVSFGIQGGMVNYRSSANGLNPYDPADPFTSNLNITKASLGAGVIVSNNRLYVGLSSPRMLSEKASMGASDVSIYKQHFYGMLSYLAHLSDKVAFKPGVLIKGVQGAPVSTDVNMSLIFNEKITAGLFTRNLNAYGMLFQARSEKGFRFTYIFELPSNKKSVGINYPTHEVGLGISLALLRKQDNSIHNF